MKTFIILFTALLIGSVANSQEKQSRVETNIETAAKEPRKIVMQLTSSDTTVHKMLMKQVANILSVAPDTKIEIVCHGPGLSILNSSKSIVGKQLDGASAKGVDIVACQFSMKERNVSKEQLYPFVRIVEAGIIEIVDKQNEGWVYIKAG
jgi:intracellular sulfur oxidation DsrE/DsrF family protein